MPRPSITRCHAACILKRAAHCAVPGKLIPRRLAPKARQQAICGMRQQRGGRKSTVESMLESAKRLMVPSARSDVPAFMVMDVIAAAARIEAAGGLVIHMEVGQPAAPAPKTAREAARTALAA